MAGGEAWAQSSLDPPTSFLGGRIAEHRHGYATLGYPDVEGGVRFPRGRWDISARLRVAYGTPSFSYIPNAVAFLAGTEVRWRVLDSGDLSGVVIASVSAGPAIGAAPVALGLGLLSPGFLVTYRLVDVVDLTVGLQLQADLWVQAGGVFFWGALPIIAGGEIRVGRNVVLGLRAEVGPSFAAGNVYPFTSASVGTGSLVGGRVRAVIGAAVDF
ncbi:MAG: hypothetical protein H6732_10835 [Alphaproteobacteria bacterium]|nr:hypothetical protein [Alphaproteobacteria bacterium]